MQGEEDKYREIIELNADNFDDFVLNTDFAIIYFYTNDCIYCQKLFPTIVEISQERPDITIGKVNIEEEREFMNRYNIVGIPTLLFFKNSKYMDRIVGFIIKTKILNKIKEISNNI